MHNKTQKIHFSLHIFSFSYLGDLRYLIKPKKMGVMKKIEKNIIAFLVSLNHSLLYRSKY